MRMIITSAALFVTTALIILCHSAIISKNVRESEVHFNLEVAMDYALDKMQDYYTGLDLSSLEGNSEGIAEKEKELAEDCIKIFCNSLQDGTFSDGSFEIYVTEVDIRNGSFDIVVKQTYSYHFMGLVGSVSSQRAVVLE